MVSLTIKRPFYFWRWIFKNKKTSFLIKIWVFLQHSKEKLFTFARNIFANLVQQTTSRIQRVQKIKSRNAVLQESEGKRYLFIIFHQYYHDLLSKISSISFVSGYQCRCARNHRQHIDSGVVSFSLYFVSRLVKSQQNSFAQTPNVWQATQTASLSWSLIFIK